MLVQSVAWPALAEQRLTHRLAIAAGFEARVSPDLGGHGYGLVAYDLDGLPADAHLGVSYNTETARLAFDRIRFAGGLLEVGAGATYEFVLAGLLPDYFRNGRLVEGRGFDASYLELWAHFKANLPRDNFLEVAVGARRWWFAPSDLTAPALVLPRDTWVLEPRLKYTFWRLRDDPSLRDRHRLFPRVRGVAFGAELGLDFRSARGPFGALDPAVFDPVDPRNAGDSPVVVFRQWLRAGWQIGDRFRIQVAETAGAGSGEDDLTRARIGGLNAYVVPLAGAPWAALLADRFIALEISLHVRIFRELELGVLGDGVALEDPQRIGEREFGLLGGLGAFADFRLGGFQIDLRGGWTPSLSVPSTNHWSVFIGLGWGWQSR
jgi:hypothetical protein